MEKGSWMESHILQGSGIGDEEHGKKSANLGFCGDHPEKC